MTKTYSESEVKAIIDWYEYWRTHKDVGTSGGTALPTWDVAKAKGAVSSWLKRYHQITCGMEEEKRFLLQILIANDKILNIGVLDEHYRYQTEMGYIEDGMDADVFRYVKLTDAEFRMWVNEQNVLDMITDKTK